MKNYLLHSVCYEKELFRRQIILLNDNEINYKLIENSNITQYRAPLSNYFEVEIHILEGDFEKADKILKTAIE